MTENEKGLWDERYDDDEGNLFNGNILSWIRASLRQMAGFKGNVKEAWTSGIRLSSSIDQRDKTFS